MFCPVCGNKCEDGSRFCGKCGSSLEFTVNQGNPVNLNKTDKQAAFDSGLTYNVDLVMCIDATESMDGILNIVKGNATNLYRDIYNVMSQKNKRIDTLRVRVIAFRDYLADGDDAMLATDFFVLPEDSGDFNSCVHSIKAMGGGDEPEDGLEALGYAIRSKWNQNGIKKRHVIVVWTDAPTHKIGYGRQRKNYPSGMAKTFNELTAWWGSPGNFSSVMDQYSKRLVLFAPDCEYWNAIAENWDKVIQCHTVPGNGLHEQDYETILNVIANTI